MASFLKVASRASNEPYLETGEIFLRPPIQSDWESWAHLRNESREFLIPWEPTWANDELSRAAYRRRLRRYNLDAKDGTGQAFFIFSQKGGDLLGGMTLSNVRRGVTQTGTLGYWMGQCYAGKGYMSQAVRRFLDHSFNDMKLHRIEAACIPDNEASKGVLRNAGFQLEGHARKYLKINGRWRDHLLFGIVDDDPRQPQPFELTV